MTAIPNLRLTIGLSILSLVLATSVATAISARAQGLTPAPAADAQPSAPLTVQPGAVREAINPGAASAGEQLPTSDSLIADGTPESTPPAAPAEAEQKKVTSGSGATVVPGTPAYSRSYAAPVHRYAAPVVVYRAYPRGYGHAHYGRTHYGYASYGYASYGHRPYIVRHHAYGHYASSYGHGYRGYRH